MTLLLGLRQWSDALCNWRFRICYNGGSATATVACNKDAEISKYAQMPIEVDAGPEFLTGSTRLKSGTAQN